MTMLVRPSGLLMAGKWDTLGSTALAIKAAARRPAVLAYAVPSWREGDMTPTYSAAHFEQFVTEGYQKNELIFACLTANADSAAALRLKVYDRASHTELKDHPLRRLLERPSPFLSEFDFWALTSVYEDIAGVAYWQKVRTGAQEVVELFPLRPDKVAPLYSSTKFISAYRYQQTDTEHVDFAPSDVLVFKRFDPRDLRQAISPLRAAARAGDVDNALTDYLKVFEEKGFQPPGVLKSKLELTDDQVDRILNRLEARYGGVGNWNRPLVLDSDAEYQRTGSTLVEMDFTAQDERNEARICEVLGVPPIIAGARIGLRYGTYANYQEARLSYWEDKLTPRYKHRSDVIDAQLAPDFGDDVDTAWDYSEVPALQEKKRLLRDQHAREFQMGLITRNMFFEKVGEDKLPAATGDVFVQSIAVTSVPLDGPKLLPATVAPTPPPAQPPEPPTPAPDVTTNAEAQDAETVPASAKAGGTDAQVKALMAAVETLKAQVEELQMKASSIEPEPEKSAHADNSEPEPAQPVAEPPAEPKAAPPLPFDDLLTVTDDDLKRWDRMYQKLKEMANAGPTGA